MLWEARVSGLALVPAKDDLFPGLRENMSAKK
jgi:hypothetical protein